tara:strand:- start:210 stop:422 length:213 start_codon:yes stop_codon:yes gene_type:complete
VLPEAVAAVTLTDQAEDLEDLVAEDHGHVMEAHLLAVVMLVVILPLKEIQEDREQDVVVQEQAAEAEELE